MSLKTGRARATGFVDFENACRDLDDGSPGWYLRPSVRALGRLLAEHRAKLGNFVLTTNFDPLIQIAVQRAGGRHLRLVLHDDGSLRKANAPGVQVVHLHGYWFGSDTLHVPTQLGQPRPQLGRSLERLLERRTLIVLSCGGWDDVFVSSLASMLADTEAAPDVVWTFYESNADEIYARYRHVFAALAPGIARSRVIFYNGIDVHAFVPRLLDRLQANGSAQEPDEVRILLERLLELAPELREKITERISPALFEKVDALQLRHAELEEALERQTG